VCRSRKFIIDQAFICMSCQDSKTSTELDFGGINRANRRKNREGCHIKFGGSKKSLQLLSKPSHLRPELQYLKSLASICAFTNKRLYFSIAQFLSRLMIWMIDPHHYCSTPDFKMACSRASSCCSNDDCSKLTCCFSIGYCLTNTHRRLALAENTANQ
jgi:hypothetical protein